MLKKTYLLLISLISNIYYRKKLSKKKIVILVDFEEDINELLGYLETHNLVGDFQITVYFNPRIRDKLMSHKDIRYREKKLWNTLGMVKEIQSCLFVILDNYVAEIGAMKWNASKTCIQIWHANGALKKFGLFNEDNYRYSDLKRYRNVYRRYDKILVGSSEMKGVFKKAFQVEDGAFLETGTLRTDKYFRIPESDGKLSELLASKKDKQVVLYTPTYREGENHFAFTSEELEKWRERGYIFIVRAHPTVNFKVPDGLSDFLINGQEFLLHELLFAADILITDYSSIAMEFSLLNKPIYFYCYDIEQYRQSPGLIDGFEEQICSPIFKDAKALLEAVSGELVKPADVEAFNRRWNTYTDGSACASLLSFLELREKEHELSS
ncbi:CDP-glycerol glycerophosphotransferase, TagB/SpsB family [Edaphobacillus lindanitolerans]|uniref:CDP-glycerol glycerophosphotransferase, TagB/SpsB family n=1 Tax=Edaphobacillus lindanitolerans TaxID=550447 RepID=A0A1U7PK61_9BACI|nr:CDP-glycerol glycerophosphotransferase, TagB/SpsB family [Edaphobacillus lindanitolerans]